MKLYYFPGACALASHIVLEWIGAPYQTVKMTPRSVKQPDYLRLNPGGTVPLLIDDDFSLTETVAILGYLADLHPEAKLLGDGTARGRAEVTRWLAFLNSDVHKSFKPIFVPSLFLHDRTFAAELAETARSHLRALFERIEQHMQGRDYIAGQRSITDPYLLVMLRWTDRTGVDISDLVSLRRFAERMLEDRGVQTAIAEEEMVIRSVAE